MAWTYRFNDSAKATVRGDWVNFQSLTSREASSAFRMLVLASSVWTLNRAPNSAGAAKFTSSAKALLEVSAFPCACQIATDSDPSRQSAPTTTADNTTRVRVAPAARLNLLLHLCPIAVTKYTVHLPFSFDAEQQMFPSPLVGED